jgi:DNA repair protein REV1
VSPILILWIFNNLSHIGSTHVVTCSLTPAKIREFKNMKIATPEWLIKSIESGELLPWYDFKYEPTVRPDATQGKKAPQKSLFHDFMTQPMSPKLAEKSVEGGETPIVSDTAQKSSIKSSGLQPVLNSSSSPPRKQKALHILATPSGSIQHPLIASTSATPIRPLLTTDPASPGQVAPTPKYAADKSNVAAQRAMADSAWRATHTSVAPDFIEGYYRNSRLHHLSTWKAELRSLVAEAQERAENGSHSAESSGSGDSAVTKIVRENMNGKNWARAGQSEDVSMKGARLVRGKGKEPVSSGGERVIMHCDFDSFFVSAGLVDRPHLRGKPVVVCHSQGAQGGQSSTSEIASASYEARKFGIKSGMR